MTLYRQLAMSIVILLAVGFIGTVVTSTGNLRSFLETQLATHAQDTATSLGLSLSPHIAQKDLPVIGLMIDAIFDRGYFQSIRLIDIDGNTLVDRTRDIQKDLVPAWFERLVSLQTPQAEAIVMSGWKQAGSVYVMSHPGTAYQELWSNTKDIFLLFLAVASIVLTAALLALRILLRPLHEVEIQAKAICERSWILQSKLPKTRELRSVVVAMNKLTSRVREIFSEQSEVTEKLRRQIYLDEVTGLPNRRAFMRQCNILLESGDDMPYGALFLVKLAALKDVDESAGHPEGDELLRKVTHIIKEHHSGNSTNFIARISGSEFGVLLNGIGVRDAENLATDLCESFKLIQAKYSPGARKFAHIGITMWEHRHDIAVLLAESDHALRTASNVAVTGWHRYQVDARNGASAYGKEYLRSRAQIAVESGNIKLYVQAVYSNYNNSVPVQQEILMRLPESHDKYTNTGIYHPAIDSMKCASSLDRLVVEKVLAHIAEDNTKVPYAINLSTASIRDPEFIEWLVGKLDETDQAAGRVQLEMMENTVVSHIEQTRDLVNRLVSAGCQVGIDHFGKDFHPFGYLSTLKISYIKIDGYYTRRVCQSSENQFFIRALRDTVHTLGIKVVGQSIETSDEYETLQAIKLDGYQGYVFGKPEPLSLYTPANHPDRDRTIP